MKTVFLKNSQDVHVKGVTGDYTLCGDAMEGDCEGPGLDVHSDFGPSEVVRSQYITCERCREIIELCHAINGAWLTDEDG